MQRSSTRNEDMACFLCDNWWWLLILLVALIVIASTFSLWGPLLGLAATPEIGTIPVTVPIANGGDTAPVVNNNPAPAATATMAPPIGASAQVGSPALDFSLQALDGSQVALSSYKGRPVLLAFIASWSPECRAEAPLLKGLAEQHQGQGLQVVAVNVTFNDKEEDMRTFAQDQGWTFPVLLDKSTSVSRQYNQDSTPGHVFIGKDGLVKAIVKGAMNQQQLEDNTQLILQ